MLGSYQEKKPAQFKKSCAVFKHSGQKIYSWVSKKIQKIVKIYSRVLDKLDKV